MAKIAFTTRAAEDRGPGYTLQVAEDIIPIAELKAGLSRIVRDLDRRARPLVVTLNGKPAAVVMSPAAYDRLHYESRFLRAVGQGLEDADAGRTIDDAELGRRLAKRRTRRCGCRG